MEQKNITELKFKRFPIIPELNEEERYELKKAIEDYGYIDPIVINANMEILDGNHRAEIWNELGGNKIPITKVQNHPELDSDEMSKEAFQIRRCLTGRNIRDTDTRYKLIARLSEIMTSGAQSVPPSVKRYGDSKQTAKLLGIHKETVKRAKRYVQKLQQEGKERADYPESYVRPTPEPKIPTIDEIIIDTEIHILKATSTLKSNKLKENFLLASEQTRKKFRLSIELFLNQLPFYFDKEDLCDSIKKIQKCLE